MAISSAGRIADQTIRAQSPAKDAIAEARAVRKEVESRISELSRHAEVTTSSVVGGITGHVREVVEQSEVKTSRAVGNALQ